MQEWSAILLQLKNRTKQPQYPHLIYSILVIISNKSDMSSRKHVQISRKQYRISLYVQNSYGFVLVNLHDWLLMARVSSILDYRETHGPESGKNTTSNEQWFYLILLMGWFNEKRRLNSSFQPLANACLGDYCSLMRRAQLISKKEQKR